MDTDRVTDLRIVVVTGPPGAGKSTVAPLIAGLLGPKSVCIEADWFWTTIRSGFMPPWEREADDQNRTVLTTVTSAAAALAAGGYATVVEGIIGPWHLPIVTEVLSEGGIGLDYVVLRPDLAICLDRVSRRVGEEPRVPGHPPLAESGPVHSLWDQFSNLGSYETHVVDPAGSTPEQTARHLVRALNGAGMRVNPHT